MERRNAVQKNSFNSTTCKQMRLLFTRIYLNRIVALNKGGSVFTGRRNQTPRKWKSSNRGTTNLLVQIPTKRTNKEECWKQLCNPPDAPRALAEAPGQVSLLSPVNHICRLLKCSN